MKYWWWIITDDADYADNADDADHADDADNADDADDADDADEADAGECTCGAKKGNKIVGGEEASVGWITLSIILIMIGVRMQYED